MSTRKSYLIDLQVTGATQVQGALNGIGKSMAALATAGAAMAIGRHMLSEAIQAESAQKKLQVAIGRTSASLNAFASAREKATRFDDDGTVAAMAAIGAFTKEEASIKRLTIAAQDLAEAKGMDLTSAAELVAKSVYGATNALGRYGVTAEGAAGSTERLDAVTRGITALWGGQATAAVDTLSGKLDQAKNTMNNLAEEMGESLIPAIVTLAPIVTGTADAVRGLVDALDMMPEVRAFGAVLDEQVGLLVGYTGALSSVEQQAVDTASQIREMKRAATADESAFQAAMVPDVAKMEAAWGAWAAHVEKLKAEEQEASRLRWEKIEQETQLIEIANEQAAARSELALVETDLASMRGMELENVDALIEANKVWSAAEDEWLAKMDSRVATIGNEVAATETLRQAKLSLASTTIGSIASMNQAFKGSAMVTKRFMQAQAVIDTYAGATRALGAYPPPLSFIMAATVIAQGLANVAQIQSQNFADGGWVRGHGGARSDSVPTRLSAGERVLSAREIAAMGGRAGVDAAARGMRGGAVVNVTLSGPIDRQWWQDVALPQLQDAVRLSA